MVLRLSQRTGLALSLGAAADRAAILVQFISSGVLTADAQPGRVVGVFTVSTGGAMQFNVTLTDPGNSNLEVVNNELKVAGTLSPGTYPLTVKVSNPDGWSQTLTQQITVTATSGYGNLVDELGNTLVDELGNTLIGQSTPSSALIKDVWAARGGNRKFGIAVKPEYFDASPAYYELCKQEASMLVPETAFQPRAIQDTRGVFTFGRADAFVAYADQAGLPFRMPAGMIYPRHDMAWVSTWDDSTQTIVPTLDGSGNPNINALNWQQEIDNHLNAIAAKPWAGRLTTINVSNETTDPLQTDGWRRHPWYNATNGPGWLVYAFQKARQLWPNTPLGLCQDITEQAPNSYYTGLRTKFLANLQQLLSLGVSIDYVDLQGHLTFERGYDPVSHRAFLQAIKDMGLKIIVGELDIRTGNTGQYIPANYTNAEYDAKAAYMVSQYLDTILPFVDGGQFVVWGLTDTYQAWNSGERPLLYDTSNIKKPAMYAAVYEHLAWR